MTLAVTLGLAVGPATAQAQNPPPAPDNAWLFDDGSGTTLTPFFGQAEGTLTGGPTWNPDDAPFGTSGSLEFDGTDDVIEVPDLATRFNGSTLFTISFWIKSAMVPQDTGFWEARDSGGADTWGIRYDDEGATAGGDDIIKLGMTFDTSPTPNEGIDQQESMAGVQTTEWQHIVMVWESGVGFSLYIDGQLDNPTSAMQTTEGALAEMDRFRLGDGAKGFWTGQISEVAVWGDAALSEDQVQWLVNNSLRGLSDLPRVTNLSPTRGTSFHPSGDGISFNAVVEAPKTIPEDGISMTLNGEDVTSELTISGDGQDRSVTYTGLEDNRVYTGSVEVVDSEGETASATLSFNTFDLSLATIIEAEDYNYSDGVCDTLSGNVSSAPTTGGMFINDPDPSAFVGGSYINQDSGYVDRVGMRGVDFFDNKEARDPDSDDIQNFQYRFCDPVGTEETADQTRQKYVDAGAPDYQLHLVEAGEWWNYTREFDDNNYNVYLRTSAGSDQTVEFARVTSDASQGDQTTLTLGTFNVASGGFDFTPLAGVDGEPLVLNLSGEDTFRMTAAEADNDLNPNYIMFVPTSDPVSVIGPLAENQSPAPGAEEVSRKAGISADIVNRQTSLDDSTVQLEVDGTDVTSETDVTANADGASVSYQPATEFEAGSEHTVALSYSDTEGNAFTVTWNFAVSSDVEPPTLVEASGAVDGSNLAVTVGFSEAIDSETATNPDNYAIDQGVSIDSVELGGGNSFVTINASSGGAIGTRYVLTVNNVQDAVGNPIAADSQIVFFGLGGIVQDENGFVVFEVEDFDRNLDGLWQEDTERGNPSGGASMVVPNGTGGGSEDATKLEYDVEFTQTGTHIVWYRASGNDGGDDSGWFHFDGARPPNRTAGNEDSMSGFSGALDFEWNSDPQDGDAPFDFEVPSAGMHVVAIALREDGSFFDKMIITTDENFVPSGLGPPSTREGKPASPTVAITGPSDGATFDAGSDITFEVDTTSPGTVTLVEFFQDGTKIGEATEDPFSFTWESVPTGRYSVNAVVHDDNSFTGNSETVSLIVGTPPPLVLFVLDPVGDEQDAIGRLEGLGFDVEAVAGPESTVADADGAALIVISSTVSSGDVADRFTDVAVPLINWEQALQDDLLETGDTDGTDRATLDGQTDLDIVNESHSMAAGLSGTVTVYDSPNTVSWGNPGANADNAIQVATVAGNPDQWLIYGYESGATLWDGSTTAPARRVHFFLADNTAANLTDEGWQLFDAAVEWAVDGLPEPPADEPTIVINSQTATDLTLSWEETGFHLQETTSLADPQWTDVAGGDAPPVTVNLEGDQKYFRLTD